jgi:coenzyme F420 hydrogenase subunit beta
MLIWLRDHDYIDAALVSGVEDDDAWKAKPVVVSTKDEILATAGSRYTYCANPLAIRDAKELGHNRLALVGMGCQTSSPPVMWDRKAGKVSRPFLFNIGCCARRRSTTRSSPSCSRPSTASRSPRC